MAGASGVRHFLAAFFAGETDPHLEGRIDTEHYAYSLTECENWVALTEGPLVKRQGFFYVCPAAESAQWLTAFRRSIEDEYVLEWSDQALRFHTWQGRVENSPGTAYEVTVPYSAAEARYVCHQQSYNRLYLNHASYPPASLLRTSATTFSFAELTLENGPFLDTNSDEGDLISATGVTGSITLTATGHTPFESGHEGSLIRLEARDFAAIPVWEAQMKGVTIGDKIRSDGKVYQAASAGITGSVQPTHTEGTYYDGSTQRDELNDKGPYGVRWTYLHDRFGVAQIDTVASATSASATVLRRLPDAVTSGTYKWALGAFSDAEGWPELVALFKGRRIDVKGLDIIGSVVDDYGGGRVNYATFSSSGILAADLGFRRTLSFPDPPLWLSPDRRLLAGTASQELAIGPANSGAAFSGENIEAEPQSFYGSERIFPVKIATETIFVERGGRRLRSADYDFGRDRYDAPDQTALARHITEGGVVQLAYQRSPYAMEFAVRGDGQLVCHPKSRDKIKGHSRFRLGGGARVLSAVCIMGQTSARDDLWLLVERENGAGATVREIWQQAEWRELGAMPLLDYYVDGGARFMASGGDGHFTGFDHLAGQEVVALVDGVVVRGLTVAGDGSLDLPADQVPEDDYWVTVGLPYTATATSQRPNVQREGASSLGLRQRALKVVSKLLEALGLKVAAPGQAVPEEVVLRQGEQQMDKQIPLNSEFAGGLVEADFDESGRVSWIHDDPLPARITMAVLNLDVSWDDE